MGKGILYGIGVGPGDPELLTLKAVRCIREADLLALPGEKAEETLAYRIALGALPEIADKNLLSLPMPMTRDRAVMEASHREAADRIEACLREGRSAAFLTLGDPSIYSTYSYVQQQVLADGFEAETIPGVPSFCAAAARLNRPIAIWQEPVCILPAGHDPEEIRFAAGTSYILMKSGRQIPLVKKQLLEQEMEAVMAENCGLPEEGLYFDVEAIPEKAGYYALILAKKKETT